MESKLDIVDCQNIQVISTEDEEEAKVFIDKARGEGYHIFGTHSGVFHCDEVLACAMLRYTKEYSNPAIVRSRNPSIHSLVDILMDVGDIFDPTQNRFDHHQGTFNSYFHDESKDGEYKIKMSSAGLIFKYFGKQIIKNLAESWKADLGSTDEEINESVDKYHHDLYGDFIKEVDAIDNGVSITDKDTKARYRITTGLASRVGRLNPAWNSDDQCPNKPFVKAMGITDAEFLDQIHSKLMISRPAYNLVKTSFETRKEFHESGELILFTKSCPWKGHLYTIEEETKNEGLIKFAIFESHDGSYRVQAVSVTPSSFENRISLHKDWRGKRGEELQKISGLDSIVFTHHNGFIGGAKKLEHAIKMAELSMEKHRE